MNNSFNKVFRPVLEALPENNRLERIWVLAKVDFKRRYYNSSLGIFWALLNPVFQICIYYFVFTYMFNNQIENFALYMFAGILFWMFFSETTKKSFSVLKAKKYLIENIVFEKSDLFLSSTISVFFGFAFNLLAFLVFCLVMGLPIGLNTLWMILFGTKIFIFSMAVGLSLATIHIFFTDLHQLWDIIMLAGFWANPIFYPQSILLEQLPFILYLNPVAGIIINFRETVLYGGQPIYWLFIYDIVFVLILYLIGTFVFNKYSHKAIEKL